MFSFIKTHRITFLLLIALTTAALVRLPQIYGDPPGGDISRSGTFLADEGSYGSNALHWALTGEWYIPDGFNPAVNTPIFTMFEYALLRGFGVSLASIRYGSIFCGLITLILLYVSLRKIDRTAAVIAVFLGALNFPMIVYNRLALTENLFLCFLLGLALLLMSVLNRPNSTMLLLGFWLIFVLGYLTKALIPFFIVIYIFMTLQARPQNLKRQYFLSVFSLVLFSAALWFFWISKYPDDWRYFQNLNIRQRISLNPVVILQNYARFIIHIKLFEFMPVIYTIALWMVLRRVSGLWSRKAMIPLEHFLIIWFLAGSLFLGFFSHSPPRYSLMLLPAILGLNGLFFSELLGEKSLDGFQNERHLNLLILAGVILLQIAFGFYRIFVYKQMYLSCFLPMLGILGWVIFWFFKKGQISTKLTGIVLLSLIFLVQGVQIFRFHDTMKFSMYKAMKNVAKIINQEKAADDIILAGDSAPLLAFELQMSAIDIMYQEPNLSRLITRLQPQYLFLEDPAELQRLRELMPNYWQNVTLLQQYRFLNNYKHGKDAVLLRVD